MKTGPKIEFSLELSLIMHYKEVTQRVSDYLKTHLHDHKEVEPSFLRFYPVVEGGGGRYVVASEAVMASEDPRLFEMLRKVGRRLYFEVLGESVYEVEKKHCWDCVLVAEEVREEGVGALVDLERKRGREEGEGVGVGGDWDVDGGGRKRRRVVDFYDLTKGVVEREGGREEGALEEKEEEEEEEEDSMDVSAVEKAILVILTKLTEDGELEKSNLGDIRRRLHELLPETKRYGQSLREKIKEVYFQFIGE